MVGLIRSGTHAGLLFFLSSTPAFGQAATASSTRVQSASTTGVQSASGTRLQIQQAVRTYVKAVNEFDLSAYTEMYAQQPTVTSVGDGQITRGWDQIREEAEKQLGAGLEGKFRLSIGAVDVTPIGSDYALALTKFNLTAAANGAQVNRSGAMTLLFQKFDGEWKVIHDHTSTERQDATDNQQTSALGAKPSGGEPAARTIAVPIADGRAVEIKPAGYVHYTFQVPAGTCMVTGRLVGISGGKKDFESFIMDDDNFENWSAGQQVVPAWQSGRVVVKSIEGAILTGPGTYHLVLSNAWSGVTAKTVQPQALAQCSVTE